MVGLAARAGLALLVAAAACGAATLTAKVTPAFDGHFRPGLPVLLRVAVANEGPALDAQLDVVVDGVTYRQPLRIGAEATATAEVLVAAHSGAPQATVSVRGPSGHTLWESSEELGLRRRQKKQRVAAVSRPQLAKAFPRKWTVLVVEPDALPSSAAGYLAVDVVAVAGDGGGLSPGTREALAEWVRGGGAAAFVLDPGAPVTDDGLLAELGGCGARATGQEWLRAVAATQATERAGRAVAWRRGLGLVVAGTEDDLADTAWTKLVPTNVFGSQPMDPRHYALLYEWGLFEAPVVVPAVRWRIVGATVALLAGVVVLVLLVPRGWGRGAQAASVAGVSAGLAALGWCLMLPPGQGTVDSVVIVEPAQAGEAGRVTELVSISGIGRGAVTVCFGDAQAVVPLHGETAEGGERSGMVVARDGAGRWTVECPVSKGVSRGVLAWWGGAPSGVEMAASRHPSLLVRNWRFAEAGQPPPDEDDGRLLMDWRGWRDGARAVLSWQGRRVGRDNRLYRATWHDGGTSRLTGTGLVQTRTLGTLVWAAEAGDLAPPADD